MLVLDDIVAGPDVREEPRRPARGALPFPLHVLFNPVNQGYGGNQKIGYHFAIERGFDFVALVHGDGQYAPECLPDLVRPLRDGEADAVFGSRMLDKGRRCRGGMPLYKFVGNRILTAVPEPPARLVAQRVPFRLSRLFGRRAAADPVRAEHERFSFRHRDHHSVDARRRCGSRSCRSRPTTATRSAASTACDTAWDVAAAVLRRAVAALVLFYDRQASTVAPAATEHYQLEARLPSTHTWRSSMRAAWRARARSRLRRRRLAAALRARGCRVTGVDAFAPAGRPALDAFHRCDLNAEPLAVDLRDYDYVLLLDVIEHLHSPELSSIGCGGRSRAQSRSRR